MEVKAAKEQLIRELEEDIKTLTQRAVERETELERFDFFLLVFFWRGIINSFHYTKPKICIYRMKDRAKRAIALRKEEETDKKGLQVFSS